jgi:hypothetical protein
MPVIMRHRITRIAFVTLALSAAFSTAIRAECLVPTRQIVLSDAFAFLGRVVTIQELDAQKRYLSATVEVDRVWKGNPPARVSVVTDTFAVESPRFIVGETYILHASAELPERAQELALAPGTLWAGICAGTLSTSGDFSRLQLELGPGQPMK